MVDPDLKRITYVAMNSELYDDIQTCCEESNVDIEDVVDYGMRCMLDNYISNRNKRLSNLSLGELAEKYPDLNQVSLECLQDLAERNVLGVIRSLTEEEKNEVDDGCKYLVKEREPVGVLCSRYKTLEDCDKCAAARQEEISELPTIDTKSITSGSEIEARLADLSSIIRNADKVEFNVNIYTKE